MDFGMLNAWVGFLSGVMALAAGLLGALWAYTKYVLERGLLPPTQFDAECRFVGTQGDKMLLEILLHVRNMGSSTICVSDVRANLRYFEKSDQEPSLRNDPTKPAFGRVNFPRSIRDDLNLPSKKGESGVTIVKDVTFVRPGVDQVYTLPAAIPRSSPSVVVHGSFNYVQHPSLLTRAVVYVSKQIGLIQHSLIRVGEPHTVEHLFRVAETN